MAFKAERTPRRTGLWAGVLLLAVALIAVVVISLRGGDGGGGKSTTRSPSGGKGGQAAKNSFAAATLTAENVTFTHVFGVRIPSGPAGPHETPGGRAFRFDHSPAGAVLASINIFGRSESRPGPAVFEPTITEQVIGPDKDKLLANAKTGYADAAPRGTSPDGSLSAAIEEGRPNQIGMWAYRLDAYDDSSAAVNVLLRQLLPGSSSYGYFNFPFTVRWIDGDWRLVAPLNGQFASVIQRVPEVPTGYVVISQG